MKGVYMDTRITTKKIICCLCALSFALVSYVIPNRSVSLMFLINIILATLIIPLKRDITHSKEDYVLIVFWLYTINMQIINYIIRSYSDTAVISNILVSCIITYILLFLPHYIDFNVFYKIYRIVGIICIVGLLYHLIIIYLFNNPVDQILLLPSTFRMITTRGVYRPTSIFIEPSAYANFLIPLIIMSLEKRRRKEAIFFSLSVVLSTSALGIAAVCFIWMYNFQRSGRKRFIIYLLISIIFFVSLCYFFSITGMVSELDIPRYIRSFRIRAFNGFLVLRKFGVSELMLGIGAGNLSGFLGGIKNSNLLFMSGITACLTYYGLVGFFIYSYFLCLNIYVTAPKSSARLLAYLFIILSFAQSMLFNTKFFSYLFIYFILKKESKSHLVS